ncbi:MAG: DUF6044 family protein [Elusimicrobiota bacterium]|jgi:hypothetical protein
MKTTSRKASLVLLLACLWIALEHIGLGPSSYAEILDTSDQILPIRLALGQERAGANAGLWVPWIAGGTDRLANDIAFFWPERLFLLLPGWLAYQLVLLAQFLLCAFGVRRLARDRLGCDEASSLLAGMIALVYFKAHPGVETVFLPSTRGGYALLPWLLWALDGWSLGREVPPWGKVVLLGLINGLCSSVSTVLPFSLAACCLWLAVMRRDARPRTWLMLAAFSCVSALPHLRIVWAMLANAPDSQRAAWAFAAPSWTDIPILVLKSLNLAKLPLLMGLAGLFFARRDAVLRGLLAGILALVTAPGLLAALQSHLSGNLEFLKGFRWDRLALIMPLFAALFAGRALQFLSRREWWFGLTAAVLLGMTLQVKVRTAREWLFWGSYAANFSSPVLRELGSLKEEPFRVATVPHGINPAYAQAYGLETADGYLGIFSRAYQRFWAEVTAPLAATDEHYTGYFGRGGDQLYLFLHDGEPFVKSGLPFSDFYRLDLLSLSNVKYVISRLPLRHEGLKPVREPAPWPEDRKERLMLRLRENFRGKDFLYIYENTAVLPRAFLASGIRIFENQDLLLEALGKASLSELRKDVFLTLHPDLPDGPFKPGGVSWKTRLSDRLELEVSGAGPSLLVVTNTFSPFWNCEVDGTPAEILPAYGTFWAVSLPPGARSVVFRYAPPYALE